MFKTGLFGIALAAVFGALVLGPKVLKISDQGPPGGWF